jgi:hypothetical protein
MEQKGTHPGRDILAVNHETSAQDRSPEIPGAPPRKANTLLWGRLRYRELKP